MIQAIIQGLILGLTIALLIGPVFFALLNTSIQRGMACALMLAIGISLSDAIYIFITNYFILQILDNPTVEFYLGVLGGALLMIIGVQTFLKKPLINGNEEILKPSKYHYSGLILKGFLLNFVHPGVLIFWVGVVSVIAAQTEMPINHKLVLYSTTVLTIFSTDMIKAYTANRLKDYLDKRKLQRLNRIVGIVLIVFGIKLFVFAILDLKI